ncbi:type III sulfide quinone reductase, selenoprotein subtype [Dactylosporangium matsuzakiense]|uniref:Oxidoreductase n=1 Tax=Dactylosporangium matsuzakiense TaxID=53360 RepID=A0A9W6KJN3_9ACTN|nr:FAD/NAD(P)-binding oxidoreductase [Dactylosporangium matsuzakiense]UWZ48255.1 NAD(P)/FAD-dependent oxidoreductase [Dactylosporangium matsuzakiense]GLL01491.1 oxidoreductase [Dactylosporangium matsuzakiense]
MRRLLVLGAGTAGTMVVNRLRRRLPRHDWQITVVEAAEYHHYQPGYLFLPFRRYTPNQVVRPIAPLIGAGVERVGGEVERVVPGEHRVRLTDGRSLPYDYLVIATGVTPRPDQTPGLLDGGQWRKRIFDFYTFEGAQALAGAMRAFDGGRLVVHITDTPIKCPVAPLEFAFLADDHLRRRGLRKRTELTYATPLPGAFTKPVATARLQSMLSARDIAVEPDFLVERVEGTSLISYDEREIPFDLLVTVPLNMGADYVARSGLGDELNLVPVDRHTLLAKADDAIFAIGDANDIPTSKAGSVAHFAVDVFADNFVEHAAGRPMTGSFDGHANCFVESGAGKALLIDFNYDTEPLPGMYPLPGAGPFRLLRESAVNHWGKLAFRWAYWHMLLPGRPVPLPAHMSMAGKHLPITEE